jgi:short-subunit dehydrogenase
LNKQVLITGASSGIGKAFAHEFAKRSYNLILVARRTDRLNALAQELHKAYQIDSTILSIDLSQADATQKIAQAIEEKNLIVDILVNNAGLGDHSLFAEQNLDTIDQMIQVNIKALVDLTRYFLPGMIQRNHGYILNVASTSGLQAIPTMAVYAASKAFVIQFTRAIAAEYSHTKLHFTALCPGPVLTEFSQRANMREANLSNAPALDVLQPDEVAKIGIEALFKNKRVCITGWRNRLILTLSRFLPTALSVNITKKFMMKR